MQIIQSRGLRAEICVTIIIFQERHEGSNTSLLPAQKTTATTERKKGEKQQGNRAECK